MCAAEPKPANHWFHVPLQMAAGTFCVYWLFRLPKSGRALLVLGALAAIMMLMDMRPVHKGIYVGLVLWLVLIENRALDKERSDSSRELTARIKEENDRFQKIADGVSDVIQQSKTQFSATMTGIKQSAGEVTGGDTFCYLDILGEQIPLSVASIRKSGHHPLYEVNAELWVGHSFPGADQGQGIAQTEFIRIGDIAGGERPAFREIPLLSFNLKDQQSVDFNVAFDAKNGSWHELMYLRRVGGLGVGGKWMRAIKVYRIEYSPEPGRQARQVLIFQKVDDNFPTQGIDWHDWLLYDHLH